MDNAPDRVATATTNVFGFHKTLALQAGQDDTIDLSIEFDPKYSTICVESLTCSHCPNGIECEETNFIDNYVESMANLHVLSP